MVYDKVNRRARLIINADDLGFDEKTSGRIFECFERGWITSATIMANMPGFPEAAREVVSRGLINQVGLHINLDSGPAISSAMRTLHDDGQLRTGRQLLIRDKVLRQAIRDEIHAQIDTARAAGLHLSHADSHHHLHTHWTILSAAIEACKTKKIRYLRLAGNRFFPSSPSKKFYRSIVNQRIRAAGLAGTDVFTYLDRFLDNNGQVAEREVVELMAHPGVDDDYRLFQTERFSRLLEDAQLINYSDLSPIQERNS